MERRRIAMTPEYPTLTDALYIGFGQGFGAGMFIGFVLALIAFRCLGQIKVKEMTNDQT